MPVATLSKLRAGHSAPEACPPVATAPLSLTLLEGARECVELARECISRGDDPRRHLRWAMTRIRKLPAALAPPGDVEILLILADLCEYMCRELGSVHNSTGLATLERMYDLLREIRGAWVTDAGSAGPA
ncbi:MAG TPA: flagellar protein FliS [Steroidobacteraceae bacterium]|nr:flagellar protein FliS [Steroidobacteraceae bacterium]